MHFTKFFLLIYIIFFISFSKAHADTYNSNSTKIYLGKNDANTPFANSTVRVSLSSCTGTLISPQLILTAGHCGHGDSESRCPNRWIPTDKLGKTVTVKFGNDRNKPRDKIKATHWNISGSEDIVMWALERPVSPSIAIPRLPLTRTPIETIINPTFWQQQGFTMAGWGKTTSDNSGDSTSIRQRANAVQGELRCGGSYNQICVKGVDESSTRSGDSGGPLYWTNPSNGIRYVIGANQGFGKRPTGGHYTLTFGGSLRTGIGYGSTPIGITLGQWISQALSLSVNKQLSRQASNPQPYWRKSRTVLLFNWWSPNRTDNFATSDPRWSMNPRDAKWSDYRINNGRSKDGYTLSRIEGRLFNPKNSQPINTVPLFSWWSRDRADNFMSSDPRWSMNPDDIIWSESGQHISNGPSKEGYNLYRLEGYLFDPKKPRPPGTMPLYSWWSRDRTDNFTTSDVRWSMNPDDIIWSESGQHISNGPSKEGYNLYRLEGYLPTMDCSDFIESDLKVESVNTSISTLSPSQTFTIRATVRNTGNADASSTNLRYYRSTNSTISNLDTLIGNDFVRSLSPSQTSAENISLTAPAVKGNYWIGGCVETVNNEQETNNNCSIGVPITVRSPSTSPLIFENGFEG